MAKKSHKMPHLVIDKNDKRLLNRKEDFTPDDFTYDIPWSFANVVCDYLNRLRVEWVSYRYNGEPKSKYKPEVRAKIIHKKDEKLAAKEERAQTILRFARMRLIEKDSMEE